MTPLWAERLDSPHKKPHPNRVSDEARMSPDQPTRRQAMRGAVAGVVALTIPTADALPDDEGEFIITANGWVLRRDDLPA